MEYSDCWAEQIPHRPRGLRILEMIFFSAFDSVNAKRCVLNFYTVGSHGSENNRLLFKMQIGRIILHRVMFCRTFCTMASKTAEFDDEKK